MATLALAAAGAAAGSALLPTGVSVLGATISGATIGSQVGALAGRYVDQALFAPSGQSRTFEGPRLRDLHVTASSEGAPVPRVYGRARLGGQVIWANDIEEETVSSTTSSGGGKGGGGGGGATTTIEYRYYASFAVAICEGEISGLGRVWADGNELDLGQLSFRLYTGSETQAPDSLIAANVGADNAPAFRGIAYVVFERLALASYGNRLPQLSFEVHRPVESFSARIPGVVLIPGSGEFALDPEPVAQVFAGGVSEAENVHTRQGGSDWKVALDQLQATLPNAKSVSLVTSWFGTDLRAGSCQLMPGVELAKKTTSPRAWSVAGLTRATAHLVSTREGRPALAADVKAVLGASTKVVYAADWSEYFGHQPGDGSGDVTFHLDPLWASSAIDAIGLDLYWPLADWREGPAHRDAVAGVRSTSDVAYLKSNVAGGEGYDWYYASAADRDAQVRSPITDGAGKPWVFRYKDIRSWWLNAHYKRPGGVESATPTQWVPQSKPFWIMETGCPAVDKGANQPNVFVDPKSVESALPYYSRGTRDDLIQRSYLRAIVETFDPAAPGFVDALNPVSSVYGGRMVASDRIHVYCWDARPYPAFPFNTEVWGDGPNWRLGHWITGRMGAAPLAETVATLLADYGFADHDTGGLAGSLEGYVIDRIMSAREALQSLELAYFFDSLETGARIVFRQRGAEPPVAVLSEEDLVETKPGEALLTLTRAQETELPASAKVSYISSASSYAEAVAEARRLAGASGRVAQAQVPIVLAPEAASRIAETWLFETWAARERAGFAVPPSLIALEPGDAVEIATSAGVRTVRVTEIADHGARAVSALGLDADVYGAPPVPVRAGEAGSGTAVGQPQVEFVELPVLREPEPAEAGWVAAVQSPWPGGVAVYASPETTGYTLRGIVGAACVIGSTLDPLPAGPLGRLDHATRVRVSIPAGTLTSVPLLQMLAGRNAAAVRNAGGAWEVIQFATATLVGSGVYELSELLRGQGGTEGAIAAPVPADATFVLIDDSVTRLDLGSSEIGLPLSWRYGPANRDIGDASYATRTFAFSGVGLRPLSPAHVRGTRSGGDLALSWIRRTRIGGDNWEAAEVPLGEDSERYEVDILDAGGAVKRTLAASTPSLTYSAASQTADFGAPQSALRVRVVQMSAVWGRGSASEAIL